MDALTLSTELLMERLRQTYGIESPTMSNVEELRQFAQVADTWVHALPTLVDAINRGELLPELPSPPRRPDPNSD